ncbi:anti-sigma factor, partial [Bordetella bronchiseptica]|nr:anti-sigma factor [Bordetella bronchiseptica]
MPHEPVTEIDLNAYVDGQLDPARRIEVEDFLSRHPEEAMRVMADLRQRDAL